MRAECPGVKIIKTIPALEFAQMMGVATVTDMQCEKCDSFLKAFCYWSEYHNARGWDRAIWISGQIWADFGSGQSASFSVISYLRLDKHRFRASSDHGMC